MKGRGLVVVLALVLATLATAGVFLYAQGVKEEAKTTGTLVPVVVSKMDIPANSDLNALIEQEKFKLLEVPRNALVAGAVTSIEQLQNKRNSVAILAGEQIPLARIQGEGTVPGGFLGIPEGYEALTVALDAPRAIAGALTGGDNVAIYATFNDVSAAQLKAKSVTVTSTSVTATGVKASAGGDITVVLVPEVQVLRVLRPVSVETAPLANEAQQVIGQITVTLALLPEDAQRFVFSLEEGSVWLGLLAPDDKGTDRKPISYAQVIR